MLEHELAVAFSLSLVAGLMRGFAGFGSGMLMAPVFALLYGPAATMVIIVLLDLVVTAQLLPGVRDEVEWSLVGPMAGAAVLFMPLGSWLLTSLDPGMVTRAIGLIVLAFVVVLGSGWRYRGRRPRALTAGIGALSGTMMAATSMGNPPVMLYLLASEAKASVSRANVTAYFALTLGALLALMAAKGLVELPTIGTGLVLLPTYMVAVWVGARGFRAAHERLYRRVALTALTAAGVTPLVA